MTLVIIRICTVIILVWGAWSVTTNLSEQKREEIIKQKQMESIHQKELQDKETKEVALNKEIERLNLEAETLGTSIEGLLEDVKSLNEALNQTSNFKEALTDFKFTAYDLTYESCGKYPSHPEYGMTRTGLKIYGPEFNRRIAAVDPKVIPLHSVIYVEVKGSPEFNGVYFCEDTGGGVKGKHVDLFINDKQIVDAFGIKQGKVYLIKEGV